MALRLCADRDCPRNAVRTRPHPVSGEPTGYCLWHPTTAPGKKPKASAPAPPSIDTQIEQARTRPVEPYRLQRDHPIRVPTALVDPALEQHAPLGDPCQACGRPRGEHAAPRTGLT